ncbi:MAG: HAD family hydrolase [Acidobacteriota bacterium]|jgi:HAD superfamily hydrolase (TIGR01509 family)
MTLLIFDCDGVLVDSERLSHAELAQLMTQLGRPMTTEQAIEIFAGQRLQDVMRTAEVLLSKPIPADLAEEAGRRLLARFRRELKPLAGVREAIETLPLARCVASSSTLERLRISMEVTGLADLFDDRLFSADQVEHGKPAPDLFLLAARSFGVSPADCIVIEDSALGIRAARAAGMKAIGFVGASHATTQLGRQLKAAGADVVIESMSELPACVERLTAL